MPGWDGVGSPIRLVRPRVLVHLLVVVRMYLVIGAEEVRIDAQRPLARIDKFDPRSAVNGGETIHTRSSGDVVPAEKTYGGSSGLLGRPAAAPTPGQR